MDDKNQQPGTVADDSQKSDKSAEELMGQVSQADGSLEGGTKKSAIDAMADESNADKSEEKPVPQPQGKHKLRSLFNVYLMLFLLLVVAGGAVFAVTYTMNKREQDTRIEVAELTEATLEELKTSDAVVGDPRQILTIESNAVISGKVVMRDTLDIAGGLTVGGNLSIPSIQAVGDGSFGSISTNDLQAAGNVGIGGVLDVAGTAAIGGSLSVAGDINGGGRLDIGSDATISGNLNVTGTISAGGLNFSSITITKLNITGSKPGISTGGAAGGGATSSVTGTDAAGTATINTGGGTGSGILATITFTSPYSSNNPHPVITPNGSGCAAINYYVTNISASQFSIATAGAPPAGATCRFNYIVIN